MFQALVSSASPAKKARMLSVITAPHASSWVSAIPSVGFNMHLDSEKCQVTIRWWRGLNTSTTSSCPYCPGAVLDHLGHRATSCQHGGDLVTRHNHLRVTKLCHQAHLPVRIDVVYGLSGDHINTCPADVLVQSWDRGKPAAFDITVTAPLTPATLRDANTSSGAAAHAAECRKHSTNDAHWLYRPLGIGGRRPKTCFHS